MPFSEYYPKIAQLLTDTKVAVIHAIDKFYAPAPLNPWMAKYIVPSAYTPTLAERTKAIEKAGLRVIAVEILGVHFANTLKAWRQLFSAKHRHRERALRRPLLPDVGFSPGRLRGGLPPRRIDGLSNSNG